MIYTCTLNPSIDYVVRVEDFKLGGLNRAETVHYFPGGKGINVSRVLKRLGTESVALGFIGGFTGRFVKDALTTESIHSSFIEVDEPTRINVKLKSDTETEVNGASPNISTEKVEVLQEMVRALNSKDVLVLAGSIPASIPANIYNQLAEICLEKGIKFVVDTSGSALHSILPTRPFLVKPNQHELEELFDVSVTTLEEIVALGERLQEMGPRNVMITLGGDGALLLTEERDVYFANVPKGKLVNSVGAGDSTVAGFIDEYLRSGSFELAFRQAVASGSATAFSADLCTGELVEELIQQINIKKVK